MTKDQITAASSEITAFVRDLVQQWVDFQGHEENIAAIIRKHAAVSGGPTYTSEPYDWRKDPTKNSGNGY